MVYALIPCAKSKIRRRTIARYLYWRSTLFRGTIRVAESRGQIPLILSAKYGVLRPDDAVEPYDETLRGASKEFRWAWSAKVLNQLADIVRPGEDRVVSYLSASYDEFLIPLLRGLLIDVEEPFKGMGIGQRLRWLSEQLGGPI